MDLLMKRKVELNGSGKFQNLPDAKCSQSFFDMTQGTPGRAEGQINIFLQFRAGSSPGHRVTACFCQDFSPLMDQSLCQESNGGDFPGGTVDRVHLPGQRLCLTPSPGRFLMPPSNFGLTATTRTLGPTSRNYWSPQLQNLCSKTRKATRTRSLNVAATRQTPARCNEREAQEQQRRPSASKQINE